MSPRIKRACARRPPRGPDGSTRLQGATCGGKPGVGRIRDPMNSGRKRWRSPGRKEGLCQRTAVHGDSGELMKDRTSGAHWCMACPFLSHAHTQIYTPTHRGKPGGAGAGGAGGAGDEPQPGTAPVQPMSQWTLLKVFQTGDALANTQHCLGFWLWFHANMVPVAAVAAACVRACR